MTKILAINGAYRRNGLTDQTLAALQQFIEAAGGTIEIVHLREQPIEFCLNCRECAQLPGATPGSCVLQDGMQELIDKIEWADGYILISSCAAPGILGRYFFATRKQLAMTARTIGAAPVGTLFTGLVGTSPQPEITARMHSRMRRLASKLV